MRRDRQEVENPPPRCYNPIQMKASENQLELTSSQHVATDLWNRVKTSLQSKNSNNKLLQTWFEPTTLLGLDHCENSHKFRLGVPSELHKYWISENLFDRICLEISDVYRHPFEIDLVVTGDKGSPEIETNPIAPTPSETIAAPSRPRPTSRTSGIDSLNPEYIFSTFVVGRNNEFAHAASFNIAQNPGANGYNPLFLCGPTGMGKTHLLNAIGNHIKSCFPQLRITYVSAERFLNECVSSIRHNEMAKFRQKYRDQCDVLLMDDIQVLGKGQVVQEEFFHTLNHFFERSHQVVVASDRMPKDILKLEDRIRTRLEWGLIADIQMPDIETRLAILRYKAEKKNIHLPNEVATYISRISKRSIRELEGNLNKVSLFAELQDNPIELSLAKRVLANHDDNATISAEEIQQLVCDHFQVRLSDLKSKSRAKPFVTARQVAMYLIKKHLDRSLVDIGRLFGGKDHTTVINAMRKIENQLSRDSDLKRDLDELVMRIHNITGV